MIKTAVILRLCGNFLIALMTVSGYSDNTENLMRINSGNTLLPYIIAAIIADTLLAITWTKSNTIYAIHLGAYILLYGLGYLLFLADIYNLHGIGALVGLMIAPFIWGAGLIPFIICGIGRKKLKKAESMAQLSTDDLNGNS